jgi:hypothetical protein
MTNHLRDLVNRIGTDKPDDIWEAAKELSSIVTGVTAELMTLLEAQGVATRAAAAYTLGAGGLGAARLRLEELLDDVTEDPDVRGHAAEALAYLRVKESIGPLLGNLDDENLGVRYWCVFALGQIGDLDTIPALERLAKSTRGESYEGHSVATEISDAMSAIRERHGRD